MSNLATDLTAQITNTDESGLDGGLLIPLLRLLVGGDPVTIEQLAEALDRTTGDVRTGLAGVPETEYDEQGRIVGQGLTLRPTSHRFTVGGVELYTWCALDTLFFPALLERAARIESVSPVSGDTIRVAVDPASGITSVEPSTAMVSLVNPKQITSIRSAFCNQVHYFTSPEDADGWLAEHPEAEVVPVAEAFQIGASLAAALLSRLDADSTGSDARHCC